MPQRIGIMGGTFNPVHLGHLITAQTVAEKYRFKYVLFIPCCLPPHKHKTGLIDAGYRLQMLHLATSDNPIFRVLDIEIKRGGNSYSIDTIKALQDRYPKSTKFYFIIGSDELRELPAWREIKELLKRCDFITIARPDHDEIPSHRTIIGRNIIRRLGPKVLRTIRQHYVDKPLIDISSTDIREEIKKGGSIKYLVPAAIERYINEHNLYQ